MNRTTEPDNFTSLHNSNAELSGKKTWDEVEWILLVNVITNNAPSWKRRGKSNLCWVTILWTVYQREMLFRALILHKLHPPNSSRTKALRFMVTSQLGNSPWPPPTQHFLFLRSPGARLGAPAGSETRLSGQRDQGGCRLRDAKIAAKGMAFFDF